MGLPLPTITRCSYLFDILRQLSVNGQEYVSSAELGNMLGQKPATIRKDIHFLSGDSVAVHKYDVKALRNMIQEKLGLGIERRACIVGLGKLGSAFLEHAMAFPNESYRIIAGFDSNVNRLETIRTSIELFPAHQIVEKIREKAIELAIIAVPPLQAQDVIDKCCNGGVSGILNFSPAPIRTIPSHVVLKSFDISSELNIFAARAQHSE